MSSALPPHASGTPQANERLETNTQRTQPHKAATKAHCCSISSRQCKAASREIERSLQSRHIISGGGVQYGGSVADAWESAVYSVHTQQLGAPARCRILDAVPMRMRKLGPRHMQEQDTYSTCN